LGELTNPFNILRKNYELEGKKDKSNFVGYIFCVLFIILRVIVMPFILKSIQYSPDQWDPLWFKILCGGMGFISLIWGFMIFNMSSKQLAEVKKNFIIEVERFREILSSKDIMIL
jgi:hypothetical protein